MKDGKCTKKYPRDLRQETLTGHDSYPLYRRRKPGDGGYTVNLQLRINNQNRACSRVGTPKRLYIFAPGGKTMNVVYPKALE
jgi:hypothetical protein